MFLCGQFNQDYSRRGRRIDRKRSRGAAGIGYVDARLLTVCLLTPGAKPWTRDKRLHALAVRLDVAAHNAQLEPLPVAGLSLEERLKRFDPERHGSEVMAAVPIGAEKW